MQEFQNYYLEDRPQAKDWDSAPNILRTDKDVSIKEYYVFNNNEFKNTKGQKFSRYGFSGSVYSAAVSDFLVGITSLAIAPTIGLPRPKLVGPGKYYKIKDEVGGAATTTITIVSQGEETIDGATSLSITNNYGSCSLYTDGAKWFTKAAPSNVHVPGSTNDVIYNSSGSLAADSGFQYFPPGYVLAQGTTPYFDLYETDTAKYGGIYMSGGNLNLYTDTGNVKLNNNIDMNAFGFVGHVFTTANNTYNLGSSSYGWANFYLASGAPVYWNNVSLLTNDGSTGITIGTGAAAATVKSSGNFDLTLKTGNATTGTITITNGANGNINVAPNGTGRLQFGGVSVPSISSTDTLTNKRITKRTGTTTSSATPTINTDNVDFYSLTAQAVDITSFTTNLSGTPTENQTLWIAITGTAARAITWGTSFESSTVTLPTTTVSTNRLDVGFVWNTVTSKWRCVATA